MATSGCAISGTAGSSCAGSTAGSAFEAATFVGATAGSLIFFGSDGGGTSLLPVEATACSGLAVGSDFVAGALFSTTLLWGAAFAGAVAATAGLVPVAFFAAATLASQRV